MHSAVPLSPFFIRGKRADSCFSLRIAVMLWLIGTTDSFSTPSSRVCTVLSSSTNPQRSFGYACGLSPKSTAHPRKSGALHLISGSYMPPHCGAQKNAAPSGTACCFSLRPCAGSSSCISCHCRMGTDRCVRPSPCAPAPPRRKRACPGRSAARGCPAYAP